MDLVHSGPSWLEISILEAVMQELASLQGYEFDTDAADLLRNLRSSTVKAKKNILPFLEGKKQTNILSTVHFCVALKKIKTGMDVCSRLLPTLKKIKAMLYEWDAGDWKISRNALEPWLDALEGFCYDVEDIVDGIRLGFFTWEMSSQVLKLQHNLARVSRGIGRVSTEKNYPNQQQQKQQLRIEQSSVPFCESLLFDKTPFVGRLIDVETIIEELHSDRCSGVSIIGMDGLGKTSLARNIGHDEGLRHYFEILSASVSAHFQMGDIVHKLVASYSESMAIATTADPTYQLKQIIGSRRTLIILDDLWSVTDDDWERFQYNYIQSNYGSKLLITTRNPEIAAITNSTTYYLDRMTDEDCKALILKKADLTDESEAWASDVEVIAKKCMGMPIVASKFGFKLSRKRSLDQRIESIAQLKNTNIWELPEFNQVFPSLKLNEPKLSPHLKRCFAYFSLFSPDRKFDKDDLIQLWEAQGFVRPQHQAGWQPTGSQCFDDLLSRSILRPQKPSNEMQPLYEMNEFIHEFAKLLASKAFLRLDGGKTNSLPSSKSVRHLSLSCENTNVSLLEQMKECKGLRTFIVLHQHESKTCPISLTILSKFKSQSLRLLDLSRASISELPMSPSQLHHLRYLDLSESDIRFLPEPIQPLRALQTLKLKNCPNLKRLPKDLNQLISLMHLYVNMNLLACVPSNLGMLTNLETLNSYAVGGSEGNTLAELKNMNRLREIHICGLKNIWDSGEAQESMLSTKHALKRLILEWDTKDVHKEKPGVFLEDLEPGNELKDLTVRNYRCQQFPTWLTSPSRRLVSIHLENCLDCKVLPSLGQLPLLKTLVLHSIDDVETVDEQFFGQGRRRFPSLESLEFRNMERLLRWDGLEVEDMPCLHSLRFINCPRLAYLPSLYYQRCLRTLEIDSCPKLKSIPEVSPGNRGKHVKVIVSDSMSKQKGGRVDEPEIEDISNTKGSPTTKTSISSEILPLDKVQQPEIAPTKPPKEGNEDHTLQVQQAEIAATKPPKQDDEDHMLQEAGDGEAMRSRPMSPPISPCADHTLIGEDKDVMSHNPESDLQHPVVQARLNQMLSFLRTLGFSSRSNSCLEESPGASDEEREDKKVDAENNVHYPKTNASSYEVLQDSSKETPQSIPSETHYPGTIATVLENRDCEDRLGKQLLEPAKEVDGKKLLFLFGEGIEFEKEMLIQLWMALGLLTDESMEDIGADYFEKLVKEKYIICSEIATSSYKVNTEKLTAEFDMIGEQRNCVILENGSHNVAASADTLHASVVCDEVDTSIFKTLGGFSNLRTLLFLGNHGSRLQQVPRDLFLCYEFLVILDLSGTHIKELPSSATKMINLRYLDVSWTFIEVLPQRIDHFKKLQTLKLEGCSRLRRLPDEMKLLTELRHLHLDVLRQLAAFPEGMGALVHIRTLSGFPVGTEEGLKIGELKHLNNIMGKFSIAKLENVQSADEAKEASLSEKRNIKMLELRWSDSQLQEPMNEDESILGNLCPDSDLEEIQIICYPGTRFADWIANASFQKLASITLFRCVHITILPSLGKLPSLVSLELFGLSSVTNMDCRGEGDHVAFPNLRKLAVDEMLNVQTWTEAREGDYPLLVALSINDCPKLVELPSLPYLPSLKNLEISGCTKLEFVSEKDLSSSLQQLIVEDCPLIEQRCSKEGGWCKIQHIPNIWIDQVEIRTQEDI